MCVTNFLFPISRFCESSCHAIGRVTGECSEDYSDCACSDETVSPKEYALCVEDGICSVYCQKKDFATGDCRGENGWDCQCIELDGKKESKLVVVLSANTFFSLHHFFSFFQFNLSQLLIWMSMRISTQNDL